MHNDTFFNRTVKYEFIGDAQDGINILIDWRKSLQELIDDDRSIFHKDFSRQAVQAHQDFIAIHNAHDRFKSDPDFSRLMDHLVKFAEFLSINALFYASNPS
jgi:hypothetical protein